MVETAPPVSPLAPRGGFPELPVIEGAEFASIATGVKYVGRTDAMLTHLAPGTTIAGVFTRSSTRSASILDCEAKLGGAQDGGAAIFVNAGNANAFTGGRGAESVRAIVSAVAKATGVSRERVLTASTGVIGEPLPHERIACRLDELAASLSPAGLPDAARAIMTTDTFPKGSCATFDSGAPVRIAGITKGSGMIAPDMATMLAYIFTDARVDRLVLQEMLSDLADRTFNSITVDGDCSTSDMVILAATGRSPAPAIAGRQDATARKFEAALEKVMLDLAHQIVRDGEGATRFVEVRVEKALNDADARTVAFSIANSPLVKTAIAGGDPNWGRIVMAIGKSGAAADRDRLTIRFGDIMVAENGWVSPGYREDEAAAYMKGQELLIRVGMGLGDGSATVWTCDLTHGYVSINADYRS